MYRPHTVSWSKTILAALSRSGNSKIFSIMGETNEGSSPKCCLVLTFLVCITKRGGTGKRIKNKNKGKGRTLSEYLTHLP